MDTLAEERGRDTMAYVVEPQTMRDGAARGGGRKRSEVDTQVGREHLLLTPDDAERLL